MDYNNFSVCELKRLLRELRAIGEADQPALVEMSEQMTNLFTNEGNNYPLSDWGTYYNHIYDHLVAEYLLKTVYEVDIDFYGGLSWNDFKSI